MSYIYAPSPPSRAHPTLSHAISPSSALSLLSTYIDAAESDASLQPHATLTEAGPVSSTSGSGAGLVIHNLKRVQAGLRGEQLGKDLSFKKYGGEGMPGLLMGGGDVGNAEGNVIKGEKKRRRSEREEENLGAGAEDWVDKEEWERGREEEDNIEEQDIGDRVQGNVDGVEAERKRRAEMPAEGGLSSKAEKEARKKAKKERGKAEKKEREKKRQANKDD